MEIQFPLFCEEKITQNISSSISIIAMDKIEKVKSNPQEIEKILISDGVEDTLARLLAEDFSDANFRATLLRRDPPKEKENKGGKINGKTTSMLLLMKSPRRSWMFQFQESNPIGKAIVPDQVDFAKALRELIA